MPYYVANLFIVVMLSYLAQRVRSQRLVMAFAFLSMVLLAAFRHYSVGTDTRDYVMIFDRISSMPLHDALTLNLEPGFIVLNWAVSALSTEFYVLLAAIAVIVVGSYQRIIVKYAVNYEIAFFVFITMGIYNFFFNGARQGIAAAIGAMGLQFIFEKRLVAYTLTICFASLFHQTALILLPAYFLVNGVNSWRRNLVILVVGVVLALTFSSLMSVAASYEERYDSYGVAGAGGGEMIALSLVSQGLFFLWCKTWIVRHEKVYHFCLNMFLIGAMIAMVAVTANVNPSGVLRLSFYFTWSIVFIWPIIFDSIAEPSRKRLLLVLFFSLSIAYYLLSLSLFSNMLPYRLNSDIFSL